MRVQELVYNKISFMAEKNVLIIIISEKNSC